MNTVLQEIQQIAILFFTKDEASIIEANSQERLKEIKIQTK
jgi:ABC-type Fe3+-hydroxamate transport system substrate-binding protein